MTGPQRTIPSNLPILKLHPAPDPMPAEAPNKGKGQEAPTSSSSKDSNDDGGKKPDDVNKGSKDNKWSKDKKSSKKAKKTSRPPNWIQEQIAYHATSDEEWSTEGMTMAEIEQLLHAFLMSLPGASERGLGYQ